MNHQGTTRRWPRLLAWAALLILAIGWLLIAGLGDRVWWALPVLFGPRWIWALFLPAFLPYLLAAPRRGVWLAGVGVFIVAFGIVDWRIGLARVVPTKGESVRVMTLNAEGGAAPGLAARVIDEIHRVHPDIVGITECGSALAAALRTMAPEFEVRIATLTALCVLTKGTITAWSERDPADAWKQSGSGAIDSAEVLLPQGVVRFGLVHLATPRNALQDFFDLSEIPKMGPLTRQNTLEREEESEHARAWIDTGTATPLIITGDFNLPVESAIYRRNWAGFRNAFSEVGWGTGYTKHTRLWGIRIDHVLSSRDVHPVRAFVGRDVGSDHLPLIADLMLPAQRTSVAR